MNKRIVFVGAQSTGKTTILKKFEEDGTNLPIITEIVRNLAKEGVKINKDGDADSQVKIFDAYEEALAKNEFISDRGLLDVVAYTVYLAREGKVSTDFADDQLKLLHRFVNSNRDIIYCYFPIEFDVVDDGVRDLDEDFRKTIDENILSLLAAFNIQFVVVSGDVEERYAKVKKLINWIDMGNELFTIIDTSNTHVEE